MFKLDEGVDSGPILAQEELPLAPDETATSLYKRVAEAHRTLIARVWRELVSDAIVPQPQDDSAATTWPGRKPADGVIKPEEMSCKHVDRLVRAVTHPYPGAFVDHDETRYIIWSGQPHPGEDMPKSLTVDDNDHLWFSLKDGCFEAVEWEAKPLT
jgi:methionyl-tRNA formyltransferase